MNNEIPTYKYCLRSDLKNNKEFLPKQSEPDATGYDVRCAEVNDVVLKPNEIVKIGLGFKVLCPVDWWLELHPRSSTFMKREMITLVGIIDQNFPKEVCLVAKYLGNEEKIIKFGDLIGQLIPVKLQRMKNEEIDEEEYSNEMKLRDSKRTGGFGSTGER